MDKVLQCYVGDANDASQRRPSNGAFKGGGDVLVSNRAQKICCVSLLP
jgi:hypothetical protein